MSLSAITTKTLFLSSLLISLRCEFVNGGSYTKTNISACRDCLANMLMGLADILMELINMPVELTGMLIELVDMPVEVI